MPRATCNQGLPNRSVQPQTIFLPRTPSQSHSLCSSIWDSLLLFCLSWHSPAPGPLHQLFLLCNFLVNYSSRSPSVSSFWNVTAHTFILPKLLE